MKQSLTFKNVIFDLFIKSKIESFIPQILKNKLSLSVVFLRSIIKYDKMRNIVHKH